MGEHVIMSGAGNRFFVVDDREGRIADAIGMTRNLCREEKLDGGLFVRRSSSADFRMVIINADGSEAEMCGNGSRCVARYARDRGIVHSDVMTFETLAGPIAAEMLADGVVRVRLTDPKDLRREFDLRTASFSGRASFVNTGVPHTIVFCPDVDQVDVVRVGREIRHADVFRPAGTNANFASIVDRRTIRVRTYERGVENETMACGTGSTASAIASHALGLTDQPVTVLTRGAEKLVVHFETTPEGGYTNVRLEGRVVYEARDEE